MTKKIIRFKSGFVIEGYTPSEFRAKINSAKKKQVKSKKKRQFTGFL